MNKGMKILGYRILAEANGGLSRKSRLTSICFSVVIILNSLCFGQIQGPNYPLSENRDGSGISWTNIGNTAASDDLRNLTATLGSNQISEALLLTNFGFSIPSQAVIHGIELNIEKSRSASGTGNIKDHTVSITLDGNSLVGNNNSKSGSNWTSTDNIVTYGSSIDTWGLILTPDEVNAPNFGVGIKVEKQGSGNRSARIDNATIVIHYSTALPVELMSFNALPKDNSNIVLSWETASETNNSHFVVERSKNAVDWSDWKLVEGAGNSNDIVRYEEVDFYPYDGNTYYRLKQVDFDGTETYYDPVVAFIENNSGIFSLYPNPSEGMVTLQVDGDMNIEEIRIFNLAGALIMEEYLFPDHSKREIDLSALPKGIFVVTMITQSGASLQERLILK